MFGVHINSQPHLENLATPRVSAAHRWEQIV